MIDVENAVINRITTDLRTQFLTAYPQMKVYGEYVEYPEFFPCVSLWMTDCSVATTTREIGNTDEHYADVMFTTEIYTVGPGRKSLAKELANFVDGLYADMGFTRMAMLVLPNVDANAFRITMRHSGLAQAPIGDDNQLISLIYR